MRSPIYIRAQQCGNKMQNKTNIFFRISSLHAIWRTDVRMQKIRTVDGHTKIMEKRKWQKKIEIIWISQFDLKKSSFFYIKMFFFLNDEKWFHRSVPPKRSCSLVSKIKILLISRITKITILDEKKEIINFFYQKDEKYKKRNQRKRMKNVFEDEIKLLFSRLAHIF